MVSDDAGAKAVTYARSVVDAHVRGEPVPRVRTEGLMAERRGVFVTLNLTAGGEYALRGCIGFPHPTLELAEGIREAAEAAASDDPRFPPVTPAELDSVVVEVSVLTRPAPVEAKERRKLPGSIVVGRDGLIVSRRGLSGLLLPQVATEFGLTAEAFLSQTCLKAGLPESAWLDPETEIQSFSAEVFSESVPRGRVTRKLAPG